MLVKHHGTWDWLVQINTHSHNLSHQSEGVELIIATSALLILLTGVWSVMLVAKKTHYHAQAQRKCYRVHKINKHITFVKNKKKYINNNAY